MIELLRVWIKAGAAGEFSSSVLTLRANSYSDRSGTYKTPVFLPKVQVAGTPKHAYDLDLMKSEWADFVAVQA